MNFVFFKLNIYRIDTRLNNVKVGYLLRSY